MADDDFERVVEFGSIRDGGYVEASVGGRPVLVARFGGDAFAVEDMCSHADSPLHGGRLRGTRIGCPLHGAMFDMKTGAAIGGGLAPCGIRTFAARVSDGWVELDPTPIAGPAALAPRLSRRRAGLLWAGQERDVATLAMSDRAGPPADDTAQAAARVTIAAIEDIAEAATALCDIAAARGLRVAASCDIASKEPMVDADGAIVNGEIFGWMADGERWWEDTRLALSSPLPRACRYESEPFWCNQDGFRTRWRNPYLEEMSLANFERRALCKAAIMVPVHLPFGQIGAVSFPSVDGKQTDLAAAFEAHSDLLATVARRFIAGYVGVMRTQQWMPSDCTLSKREVECLRWAAIGKTDKEISLILSRSHATIRYHVHRAGEKLNSVNRSQTVFKAGQLGYLGAAS